MFGLSPAGPHDENILFHAVNAVLLFWVLLQATGFIGRSFMVAALFAVHPINVAQDKQQHASVLINAWVGMAKAYRALGDKGKMNECMEAGRRVQRDSKKKTEIENIFAEILN